MSIFAAAINDIFADPELARDAHWHAGGESTSVLVRVVVRRPDRIGDFGTTRLVEPTTVIEVRTSEAPTLAEGDTFELDGEVLLVQGEPVRDTESPSEKFAWLINGLPVAGREAG